MCPHTLKFRARPLMGTASGMASDSVRGRTKYRNGNRGNDINVSISMNGSDTPVTRPETDKAGQSSRDRKRGGGKFKGY